MKAAVNILGGGDKPSIQAGEEIPDGYFSGDALESAKAAGVIEGEGPNAEEGVGTELGPTPAEVTAENQAAEKLSTTGAAKVAKAEAEAPKEGA